MLSSPRCCLLLSFLFAFALGDVGLGGVDAKCVICGLAVNELEGFLIEPQTEASIENFLQKKVCSKLSPDYQAVCNLLANAAPLFLKAIDQNLTVGSVCFDLKLCPKDLNSGPDLQSMPTYQINLNLPAEDRWSELCAMNSTSVYLNALVAMLAKILHPDITKAAQTFGSAAWALMPKEYALEIQGCANAAGIPTGLAALLNMAYELSDACTSIVAQGSDGTIFHARNLDFGFGGFLTSTMREISAEIEFVQNGTVLFVESGFVGFIGALSAQSKAGKFSITVNTRYFQGGTAKSFMDMLTEFIFGLEKYPNAHFATFLVRDVIANAANYSEAVAQLSETELMADVYYTIAGSKVGEGAVITRNRTAAQNVWTLGSNSSSPGPGNWFVLETNYDHWKPAPWFDDRRKAGFDDMMTMTQEGMTLQGLMKVLSTRPTLNLLSSYSMLAVNQNGTWTSVNRQCAYPCAI